LLTLDLVQFHTIIFYELDRQLRIVSQAKQRPWRPVGQEKEVRVYYLAYEGRQEKELRRIAEKMRAAATVEGRIIEDDSIAALYDYNPDVTAAIKEISNKIEYVDDVEIIRSKSNNEFTDYYLHQMKEFDKIINNEETVNHEEIKEEKEEEISKSSSLISCSDNEVITVSSVKDNLNPPVEKYDIQKTGETSISEMVKVMEAIAMGNIANPFDKPVSSEKENIEHQNQLEDIKFDIDEKGQMYFVFD
jgi:hypothetical protein